MKLFGFKSANTDQRHNVIAAAAQARLVVDGGPGTGKTATACARVVDLIGRQDLSPDSILVISFTRIAIREIAERIQSGLADNAATGQVRIVTLDALAAFLAPEQDYSEGHDQQIRQLIPQLAHCAQLETLRHVIVDEAHDIIGIRADLIQRMFDHLPAQCGFTILCDQAQSIYDFADRSRLPQPALPTRLLLSGTPKFSLSTLYRTTNPTLTRLYTKARAVVLSPKITPQKRFQRLERLLHLAAPSMPALPQTLHNRDDLLILYRHRADVLAASTQLAEQGIAHRLRLSGLAPALPAWIGLTLARQQTASMSFGQFNLAWEQWVKGTHHASIAPQDAWERLHRHAALGPSINLIQLRARLLQSSPPIELCEAESGLSGPCLGTIHASKGRESPSVILHLPPGDRPAPSNEDARIWFVGATRAKENLTLLAPPRQRQQRHLPLPSGRLYFPAPPRIEVSSDIRAQDLTGTQLFATAAQARAAQDIWAALPKGVTALRWDKNLNILFKNQCIGRLSSELHYDLDQITQAPVCAPLYVIGLRTLALPADCRAPLHFPWQDSGFMLAPIFAGLAPLHENVATTN